MVTTAHIAADQHGSFNRIRQVALTCTPFSTWSLGLTLACRISIGSTVFAKLTLLGNPPQIPVLYNVFSTGRTHLKFCFPLGIWAPVNTRFLRPTRVPHIPNRLTITQEDNATVRKIGAGYVG